MKFLKKLEKKFEQLVQKRRFRVLVLLLGFLQTILLSGVAFGWASISLFLQREGAYADLCPDDTTLCSEQVTAISLLFTIGVFSFSMVSLPAGYLLDHVGSFATNALGTMMVMLGFLFYAFTPSIPEKMFFVDEFMVGTALMMGGEMAIFMASFRLSVLFPDRSGLILGCVNGFFNASAFMALVILKLQAYMSREAIFFAYSIVPALFFFISPIWGNNETYSHIPPSASSPNVKATIDSQEVISDYLKSLPTLSAKMKTLTYILGVYFFTINNLVLNFYMGNVTWQIYALDDDHARGDRYIQIFAIILPFGAVFGPAIGFLLDRKGLMFSSVVVVTVGLLGFICVLIPYLPAQIFTFILLSSYQPMMYSVVTSYISILFGFENFGKLYGMNTVLNGFMNLLQYPLLILVFEALDGSFMILNVIIVVLVLLCYLLPLNLFIQYRRLRKAHSHHSTEADTTSSSESLFSSTSSNHTSTSSSTSSNHTSTSSST